MSRETEQDFTNRIIDIDTFSWYLVGFRNSVFENIPQTPPLRRLLIGSEEVNLTELAAKYGLSTTPALRWNNCFWQSVPDSLKVIISHQFEAASREGQKSINVTIASQNIRFWLNSPFVSPFFGWLGIDRSTETIISGSGLELSLKPGDNYGYWTILKRPITEADTLYKTGMADGGIVNQFYQARFIGLQPTADILEEFQRLHKQIGEDDRKGTIYDKATLPELHAIAQLIEQEKNKVMWHA